MKRSLKYLLIALALFLVIIFSLLCSNIVFKHITISLINSFVPVKVQVEKWSFNPWKSIHAKGLVVADISSETGITNFYLSANSLDLSYKAFSFFSDVPFFSFVEANDVKLVTIAHKKEIKKKEKVHLPKKNGQKQSDNNKNVISIPDFPVFIKKIVIRNFSFHHTDSNNKSFGIADFNFAGINIGPQNSGSALINGSLFYNDNKNVSINYIPFAWQMDYTIKNSLVPDLFSSTLLISNVVGQAENMNLSPLAAELNIDTSKNGDFLNISKCHLKNYWSGDKIATMSITGKVNIIKKYIDCQVRVEIWSNSVYQAIMDSHKSFDISQSHSSGTFNFNIDGMAEKHKVDGKFELNKIAVPKHPKLLPINFAGIFNIEFDNKTQKIKLNKFNFLIEDKKRQLAQLKITNPFWLSIDRKNKKTLNTNDNAKISLTAQKFNLKYLDNLINNNIINFGSGEVSGEIICDVLGLGEKIDVNSSISADKINFSFNKAKWENIGFKLNVNGNIKNLNSVSISRFNNSFFINKKKTGEIAAGGFYNILSGKEKIAIAATGISGELISPLLDAKNRKLDNLVFSLKVLSERKERIKNRKLSIYLNADNSKRLSENDLEKFSLNINADINNDKIIFNKCILTASPGKWNDNILKLTGEFDFKKGEDPSNITIQSGHFDATSLFNTFLPLEKSKKIKKGKKKKHDKKIVEKKEEEKSEEPVPPNLQFINLILKTHVDEFIVRKMTVVPLSFDFIMKNNKLNFQTRNMTVNGGDFDLKVQADINVTGYVYSSSLKTENIPLNPVLETWAPKISNKILGNLNSEIYMSGKGFSTTNIIKHFKINSKIFMNDGHLEDVPLLISLSKMMKIDDLSDYSFSKCSMKIISQNGTNYIKDISIEGDTIKIGINGAVAFDNSLDLDVYLALSGREIANIFSKNDSKIKMPFTGSLNKFYKLPMPIKVGGRMSKPKLQTNIKEFIPMLIKMMGPDVIKSFGKLFSKDKTESENAKKECVELLQGLWNELQKHPADSSQKKHNLPHRSK
jgi:hypothetical protein